MSSDNRSSQEITPQQPAVPERARVGIVYVVDDDPAMCRLIDSCLTSPERECRCFTTAEEFLAAYAPVHPACLTLDLMLPGMSGIELLRVLSVSPHVLSLPTLVLTADEDIPMAVKAIKLGAMDFLVKPTSETSLINWVESALALDLQHATRDTKVSSARGLIAVLTERERTVLRLLSAGKSSKQISRELSISIKTVSNHRSHMLSKLHAGNTADLIRTAMLADAYGDDECAK